MLITLNTSNFYISNLRADKDDRKYPIDYLSKIRDNKTKRVGNLLF